MQDHPLSFTVTPKPTDNLFFGIFPDAAAALQIANIAQRLKEKHGLRGRPLATERFHLTLYAFNPLTVDLQTIAKVAADAANSTPPLEVVFDRVLSFGGRAGNLPCVLCDSDGNDALLQFHRQLGVVLAEHGFRSKGKQSFHPHVTLLYDEQRVAVEPVVPLSWTVNKFALVHSLVGRSRYIPLAGWMLRGCSRPGAASQTELPFSNR